MTSSGGGKRRAPRMRIIVSPDGEPIMLDMHGLGLVRVFLHKGPGDPP